MTVAAVGGLAEKAERVLGRPAGGAESRPAGRAPRRPTPPSEPIFHVGRWPVMSSFWYFAIASSLIPAKKLYELLYSRRVQGRTANTRWRAAGPSAPDGRRRAALRPLAGRQFRAQPRSWSGLTLMRSKSGEFVLIGCDYAGATMSAARLDRTQIRASRSPVARMAQSAIRGSAPDSDFGFR